MFKKMMALPMLLSMPLLASAGEIVNFKVLDSEFAFEVPAGYCEITYDDPFEAAILNAANNLQRPKNIPQSMVVDCAQLRSYKAGNPTALQNYIVISASSTDKSGVITPLDLSTAEYIKRMRPYYEENTDVTDKAEQSSKESLESSELSGKIDFNDVKSETTGCDSFACYVKTQSKVRYGENEVLDVMIFSARTVVNKIPFEIESCGVVGQSEQTLRYPLNTVLIDLVTESEKKK